MGALVSRLSKITMRSKWLGSGQDNWRLYCSLHALTTRYLNKAPIKLLLSKDWRTIKDKHSKTYLWYVRRWLAHIGYRHSELPDNAQYTSLTGGNMLHALAMQDRDLTDLPPACQVFVAFMRIDEVYNALN